MKLDILFESSDFVIYSRRMQNLYSNFESRLNEIYENSKLNNLFNLFIKNIKNVLKYSLLCKITEIKTDGNSVVFTSVFIKLLGDRYNKLIKYLNSSITLNKLKSIKISRNLISVRKASLLAISAVSLNILISLLLQKELNMFAWVMRVFILLISLAGLTGKVHLEDIKTTSHFIKIMGL